MRNECNRKKLKTVFVLGAGASYALSLIKGKGFKRDVTPLDKDFLDCIYKLKSKSGWKKNTKKLIEDSWLGEKGSFKENGLEQAIITRVSQYDNLINFNPQKNRVSQKLNNSDYIYYLSHLVCDYLIGCKINTKQSTTAFINHIFPEGISVENYENRIITFNYDTLIDNNLLSERDIPLKKLYFDKILANSQDKTKRKQDEKFLHPLMLKLHGSINWGFEKNYFDQLIEGNISESKKIRIWQTKKINKPNNKEYPLIIPPIANKPITKSSIFKFLWNRAYEYLSDSERVVIIGYSCPLTDTAAHAMFSHIDYNKRKKEIVIVDPDACILNHYKNIMNKKLVDKVRWIYYSTFDSYIKHECN